MKLWQRALQHWIGITQVISALLRLTSARRFVSLFVVTALLSVSIASCSSGNSATNSGTAANPDVELTLVSFAVTKAAHEAIIPKFVEQWKKDHNQTVTFKQSYGGSGSQTRAVIDGLEADIVHLALAGDTNKIVKAGLIEPGWEKEAPNEGTVSKTVAALITRPGNPKNIKDWADLTKDGVTWITADPKTSGIARWNFLALWNAVIKSGANEAKAQEFVTKAFKNVPVLAKDAREASDVFLKQGQGDALINYENEIILAAQKGEKADYVLPEVNISIDNPIAIVDKNVDKHKTRAVAEGFVKYLFSPEAQAEFGKTGFRPVVETVAKQKEFADKYKPVKTLSTIKDYGGWTEFQKKFFDDGGVFDQIQGSIKR
jgi:sulfate/thiosulfate transport system substrate-binding protein